jgi:hypothetical protein
MYTPKWLTALKVKLNAWRHVQYDVTRSRVYVTTNDGEIYAITRTGFLWLSTGNNVTVFSGDMLLATYLGDQKGLLKVDTGHRIALASVREISPQTKEPHMRSWDEQVKIDKKNDR